MMLYLPDGTACEQGSPADKDTWWTCGYFFCGFTGPHVGTDLEGKKCCMGSCGGVTENPNVPRVLNEVIKG